MILNDLWFLLLGILLTGYAILDGFDLGVGILHLVAKRDDERRIMLNSIGPLWDGNEVWLVTFGGALFAAFPECYATVFSAFYMPFILLLVALIFRAVSMEFRSKLNSPSWRTIWDVAFWFSSLLATFLFGVAVGNAMLGLPIGSDKEFVGTFSDLLRPYSILIGFFTVSLFALHGATYLLLKTDGELKERIYMWAWHCFGIFLVFYVLATIFSLAFIPHSTLNLNQYPIAWAIVVLNVLAISNIPRALFFRKPFQAFFSTACTIAALNFLFGAALYPNLMVSSIDPQWNLTIYNAASSTKTLGIMAIIAALGMPFVLAYTSVIYWTFRGKVEIGKFGY